jgi:hypothetical protein
MDEVKAKLAGSALHMPGIPLTTQVRVRNCIPLDHLFALLLTSQLHSTWPGVCTGLDQHAGYPRPSEIDPMQTFACGGSRPKAGTRNVR